MNYFAHGRNYVHAPYLMAGSAIPDWLNVVNRRVRARSKAARPFIAHKDQRVVAIATGVLQHHRDDDWFHRTPAFAELSWAFTVAIRDRLPVDNGLRPSFLGHILVELLLDDLLIQSDPSRLDDYYRALDAVDPAFVTWVVEQISGKEVANLTYLIPRFSQERFLYDYAEDGKLLFRLNNVMQRVKLPQLPDELAEWFPEARQAVQKRAADLLDPTTIS